MKIKHFGGTEYANNISEFSEILQKRYGDDVNEFWITNDTQDNPCLVILVNKEMYKVQVCEPLYDAKKLHHWELGLVRHA